MKTTFILNGKVVLVLKPENDAEKQMLELLSKQDTKMQKVTDKSNYALVYGSDSIIITTEDAEKAKDM
jgi:hypothetical protein